MRHPLKLHPDSICQAVSGIEVEISRPRPSTLVFDYFATGAIKDVILPSPTTPARADELWQHTCFEVFIRGSAGEAYCELNFSPSTRWAVYRFDGYRSGMASPPVSPPAIDAEIAAERYEMRVSVDLRGLADLPEPWRLGISAVIEETDGRKSYWALAHPPGKADFHHRDCFVLELPTA